MATGADQRRHKFLCNKLGLETPMVVVDIGARAINADAPYQPLLDSGAANLVGFEPDKEACRELQQSADSRSMYLPHAIGKPGDATFYAHQIGSLSSLFKINANAANFLGKGFWSKRQVTEIPMVLKGLDELNEIKEIDLLKMDTQGAELAILQSGPKALASAAAIITEVRFHEMYDGEPSYADLDSELRAQGFVLHKFLFQKSVHLPHARKDRFHKRKAMSQLLDGDAVYIPNLTEPDKISDARLANLALVADAVFDSPDLCLHCLDHLARRKVIKWRKLDRYVDLLPEDLIEPVPAQEPAVEESFAK